MDERDGACEVHRTRSAGRETMLEERLARTEDGVIETMTETIGEEEETLAVAARRGETIDEMIEVDEMIGVETTIEMEVAVAMTIAAATIHHRRKILRKRSAGASGAQMSLHLSLR